jgi:hypothetical protein
MFEGKHTDRSVFVLVVWEKMGRCASDLRGIIAVAVFAFLVPSPARGVHTNQALYEEPFDLAGGGASLTRATQEGVLFANPALLPWGAMNFYWIGLKTTAIVGKDSVDFARSAAAGGTPDISGALDRPVHAGMASALSFLTGNFGLSAFARVEPDIVISRYGHLGLPEVTVQAEGYGGMVGSWAQRATSWLSLGLTGKYLYVAEPFIQGDVTQQEKIMADAQNVSYGQGIGYDAGALVFLQGRQMDFRWALKVDDVGGTEFTGTQAPLKQTISTGLGLTFHTNKDAIHLSADYRDLQRAYGELYFKRLYLGSKFLVRKWVGVAAGLYQGYPSYGVVADLLLMRVSATYYTREMGDHPGVDPRGIYMASLAFGF